MHHMNRTSQPKAAIHGYGNFTAPLHREQNGNVQYHHCHEYGMRGWLYSFSHKVR
jgi:hypothetical protein